MEKMAREVKWNKHSLYFFIRMEENKSLTVLSYNVLFDHAKENWGKGRTWDDRKESLFDVVRNRRPDVCAFQECIPNDLRSNQYSEMSNWGGYKASATREEEACGNNIIIAKNDTIEKVGEPRAYMVTETWTLLGKEKKAEFVSQKFALKNNGLEFRVFNCHLHPGDKSSVEDIYRVIDNGPTIIMGDFNGETPTLAGFSNCRLVAKSKKNEKMGTFVGQNEFDRNNINGYILDHILVSKHFTVSEYETINDLKYNH